MHPFKEKIRNALVTTLKNDPRALAAWEAGSAANGTSDSFSDLDLMIVGQEDIDGLFAEIETALNQTSRVSHRYIEPKSLWPDCYSRIYFLEGAPKHFFVDVGIVLHTAKEPISEVLQVERHGRPVIHFDKTGVVNPRGVDSVAFNLKLKKRLNEIESAFPIYKTEVFKEIDRGHFIDAYAFYFSGIIKPLVELLGMMHRPFRFDFGLRYIHKTFPETEQRAIETLLQIQSLKDLGEKTRAAELLFDKVKIQVHEKLNV